MSVVTLYYELLSCKSPATVAQCKTSHAAVVTDLVKAFIPCYWTPYLAGCINRLFLLALLSCRTLVDVPRSLAAIPPIAVVWLVVPTFVVSEKSVAIGLFASIVSARYGPFIECVIVIEPFITDINAITTEALVAFVALIPTFLSCSSPYSIQLRNLAPVSKMAVFRMPLPRGI